MSLNWRYASANQRAGSLAATVFLFGGIVGLVGGEGLLGAASLGPFRVNGPQALVHLGVASALVLGAASGPGAARGGNGIAGSAAVGLAVLGLGGFGSLAGILAVSIADAVLIAPLGLLLLSVASSPTVSRRKDGIVPPGTLDGRSTILDEQAHKLELLASTGLEEAEEGPEGPHEETGTPVDLEPASASELSELTKKELYDIARELDVTGRSRMRKRELVRAIASTRRSDHRAAA